VTPLEGVRFHSPIEGGQNTIEHSTKGKGYHLDDSAKPSTTKHAHHRRNHP
jgi:hypothetical protein